ncbi:cupin domain-containing protein [Lysobacter arvi]|uniref:Cupin domain-containing protein n=1 Tax=Lysobacter arvi TaxID=3038776 RepID=A0ABU1CI08_9GAMM|nr:cupin domain-containing protein [Lysobacter arvi]MDR0184577.1 cupin domain-containing protein [Lysobacter arvi]
MNASSRTPLPDFLPARVAAAGDTPWIPVSAEKSWKPLRFLPDGRGFVELLRMTPGAVMPLHRHTGEIHAYNLTGSRTLCTGEVVGPGDYVYEPPGNTDWWKVTGTEEMVALVVVMGAVEFVDAAGNVKSRADAHSQWESYLDHCRRHGWPVLDLTG